MVVGWLLIVTSYRLISDFCSPNKFVLVFRSFLFYLFDSMSSEWAANLEIEHKPVNVTSVVKLLGWKPSYFITQKKDLSCPAELALDKARPTLEELHQKLSQVRQRFRTWNAKNRNRRVLQIKITMKKRLLSWPCSTTRLVQNEARVH